MTAERGGAVWDTLLDVPTEPRRAVTLTPGTIAATTTVNGVYDPVAVTVNPAARAVTLAVTQAVARLGGST